MDYYEVMKAGFNDELVKIAGDVVDASKQFARRQTFAKVQRGAKEAVNHLQKHRGKYSFAAGMQLGHIGSQKDEKKGPGKSKTAVSMEWVAKKGYNAGHKTVPALGDRLDKLTSKARTSSGKRLSSKQSLKRLMASEGATIGRLHREAGQASKPESLKPLVDHMKTAGATGGLVRSGRRPMKAATLLAKDGKKKVSDIIKVSAIGAQHLALVGAGALGLAQLQKMKRRYEMGRQMEYQQRYGM